MAKKTFDRDEVLRRRGRMDFIRITREAEEKTRIIIERIEREAREIVARKSARK